MAIQLQASDVHRVTKPTLAPGGVTARYDRWCRFLEEQDGSGMLLRNLEVPVRWHEVGTTVQFPTHA
jgi:hypothetical protein